MPTIAVLLDDAFPMVEQPEVDEEPFVLDSEIYDTILININLHVYEYEFVKVLIVTPDVITFSRPIVNWTGKTSTSGG